MTQTTLDNPAAAASEDAPPKRGRGRPPGSRSVTTPAATEQVFNVKPDTAPKRSHRRKLPDIKVTGTQTKEALTVALFGLDTLASMVSESTHAGFWTVEDRLEQAETAAIVGAVYRELETYPKAMAFFQRMVVGSVHAQLAAVLMAVAIPRLARRGIVPPQMIFMAAAILSTYSGDTSPLTTPEKPTNGAISPDIAAGLNAAGTYPSAAVGAGAAYGGSGTNGSGENYADRSVAPRPFPHSAVSQ